MEKIIKLAKLFHETYEDESKKVGWETQKSCKVEFDDLPEKNKAVMISVVKIIYDKEIKPLTKIKEGCERLIRNKGRSNTCYTQEVKDILEKEDDE